VTSGILIDRGEAAAVFALVVPSDRFRPKWPKSGRRRHATLLILRGGPRAAQSALVAIWGSRGFDG